MFINYRTKLANKFEISDFAFLVSIPSFSKKLYTIKNEYDLNTCYAEAMNILKNRENIKRDNSCVLI